MKMLIVVVSLFSFSIRAGELTFLVIKSPSISWNSPRALARSTVKSINKSYGLGHVAVEISCEGRTEYMGMTSRSSSELRDAVLNQGNGLGVLFRLFEGSLQYTDRQVKDFEKMAKEGRSKFIIFKISSAACSRLLNYYDAYLELYRQRRGIPRDDNSPGPHQQLYYGFPAISRYGEGGGCSGFAISFLEVLELKESWMVEEWSRFLRVPKVTVGGPLRDHYVGLRYLYYSGPKRWARENESHFPLFMWDPDKMYFSIKRFRERGTYQAAEKYGAQGIVIDRTQARVPEGPLFTHDVFSFPSDPTLIYTDLNELRSRYEFSQW